LHQPDPIRQTYPSHRAAIFGSHRIKVNNKNSFPIRYGSGGFGHTNHKNPFFCSSTIKTQPNTNIADDRELSIISIDVSKINPKDAL